MPIVKSLSLTVQKLYPILKFILPQSDRVTDTQTDRTKRRYHVDVARIGKTQA